MPKSTNRGANEGTAAPEPIADITVLDLAELLRDFEEKFGVTAAAPVVASGPLSARETGEYSVLLTAAGDKKILVIKAIRLLTNLGLKQAKDLADTPPRPVISSASFEAARGAMEALEVAGARVVLVRQTPRARLRQIDFSLARQLLGNAFPWADSPTLDEVSQIAERHLSTVQERRSVPLDELQRIGSSIGGLIGPVALNRPRPS